jgi:hypothetical protein
LRRYDLAPRTRSRSARVLPCRPPSCRARRGAGVARRRRWRSATPGTRMVGAAGQFRAYCGALDVLGAVPRRSVRRSVRPSRRSVRRSVRAVRRS